VGVVVDDMVVAGGNGIIDGDDAGDAESAIDGPNIGVLDNDNGDRGVVEGLLVLVTNGPVFRFCCFF
jgi:hypothetical protein